MIKYIKERMPYVSWATHTFAFIISAAIGLIAGFNHLPLLHIPIVIFLPVITFYAAVLHDIVVPHHPQIRALGPLSQDINWIKVLAELDVNAGETRKELLYHLDRLNTLR